MGQVARRKAGTKNKHIKRANLKTKRYRREGDEIVLTDMLPENSEKLLN